MAALGIANACAIVTPYAWFCAIGSGLRILPLLILKNRLFQRQAQGPQADT